ncbi:putative membrane protein YeaQ/YmgE (transglycosylase-associated protein family) [Bradyrhizobium ottawaense]
MGVLWTIIIGFVAGVIAKFIMPGDNEPSGFILTTILGIVGAFVATYLGQALGWYRAEEGAGLIGAVVGAISCCSSTGSSPADNAERSSPTA